MALLFQILALLILAAGAVGTTVAAKICYNCREKFQVALFGVLAVVCAGGLVFLFDAFTLFER